MVRHLRHWSLTITMSHMGISGMASTIITQTRMVGNPTARIIIPATVKRKAIIMAKFTEKDDHASMDEMVEYGIARVIEAFGKGENLRGAIYSIVNASAHWGAENEKRAIAKQAAETKKRVAAEKRKKKA